MFLECRVRKLLYGIVRPVSSVLHSTRNVLDIVIDLLLVGWSENRRRANEVDERLDALDECGGLVFEVVLRAL